MSPEEIIRHHVYLPQRANSSGWFSLKCKVCNDHGRKGPRAGFRFEDGGNTVGYHCFNCGHAATFNLNDGKLPSRKFRQLLTAYDIPADQFKIWGLAGMSNGKITNETYQARKEMKSREPTVIAPMKVFYPLTDDPDNDMAQVAIMTLADRGIDWQSQPFYLSTTNGTETDRWYGRLIIPVYKQKQLIFYSGRDLTGTFPRKYINASVERQAAMYGYDNILDRTRTDPIFIFEGWFDAASVDGVALFGRTITPEQAYWLNSTNRQKIVVPDRNLPGLELAQSGIKHGWSVSTPDWGTCEDANDAIRQYGKLFVRQSIINSVSSDEFGLMKAKLYCGTQ